MAETQLSLLVLKTKEMLQLVAFYQALGIAFAEEKHGKGPTHFAAVMGEFVFEIYPLQGDQPDSVDSTRLGFRVANLELILNQLQERGVPILSPMRTTAWGQNAVVSDPDGRAVDLFQRQ
jgi:lactoylglutathione lyase